MKILISAYDIGGITALVPIIKILKIRGHELSVYSIDKGVERFQVKGITCNAISHEMFNSKNYLSRWLKNNEFDAILTGTSSYHNLERLIWCAAKNVKINSYAMLDFWFNLSIRFCMNPDKAINFDYDIQYVPDYIFVIDDFVKDTLSRLDIINEKIFVSGHPRLYLEYYNCKTRPVLDNRDTKRRIVLFSEQIDEIYNSSEKWGFDEYTVIEIVLEAVSRVKNVTKVIIKAHPNQTLDLEKIERLNERYQVEYSLVSEPVILKMQDVVIGTFTMAMVESLIKGYFVINIIPSKEALKYSILASRELLNPVTNALNLAKALVKNKLEIDTKRAFYLNKDPSVVIAEKMEADYECVSDKRW